MKQDWKETRKKLEWFVRGEGASGERGSGTGNYGQKRVGRMGMWIEA